jgi:hypothetical protein
VLLISHRGNIGGIDKSAENNPERISKLIGGGISVEIDVWYVDNKFMLGHDAPEYHITADFIKSSGLWCHAKNIMAMTKLKELNVEHFFWHEQDAITLTSCGLFWTYPGMEITKHSIIVALSPEDTHRLINSDVYGVCSDYIDKFW